jgi:hypothetical protein
MDADRLGVSAGAGRRDAWAAVLRVDGVDLVDVSGFSGRAVWSRWKGLASFRLLSASICVHFTPENFGAAVRVCSVIRVYSCPSFAPIRGCFCGLEGGKCSPSPGARSSQGLLAPGF